MVFEYKDCRTLMYITNMIKESYTVKYRVEGIGSSTNGSASIMLYSDNESEAIAALKSRGTIGRDKDVVILSIRKN